MRRGLRLAGDVRCLADAPVQDHGVIAYVPTGDVADGFTVLAPASATASPAVPRTLQECMNEMNLALSRIGTAAIQASVSFGGFGLSLRGFMKAAEQEEIRQLNQQRTTR